MESIRITGIIPASPERVYEAWLNSDEHSKFTGSTATVEADVGGAHSAYDGYISGKILELDENARIVQSWRTQQFKEGDPDSRLEVVLEGRDDGSTSITFNHTGIPDGQGSMYEQGWLDHYLTKMRAYFG